MMAVAPSDEVAPTRDPTYYISDGNTVLQVENTLFKVYLSDSTSWLLLTSLQVHRSMLIKDKSTFDSMFSLDAYTQNTEDPMVPTNSEGESDENPIRLHGDKAEEFSALLWSLYSLCVHIPPDRRFPVLIV